MDKNMSDTPERIYLQWFDEYGESADEVTWCEDQIQDDDVAYIRLDIAEASVREQTAKTIEMIAERNGLRHVIDEQAARVNRVLELYYNDDNPGAEVRLGEAMWQLRELMEGK